MAAQLTDEVAQAIMGEIHVVVVNLKQERERVEALAQELTKVAAGLEVQKRIIHNQNERVLLDQIKVVTQAADAIKGSVGKIQGDSSLIVQAFCKPVVDEMKGHIKELTDAEKAVRRLVGEAIGIQKDIFAIQEKAIDSKIWMLSIAFVVVALAFAAGRFWR